VRALSILAAMAAMSPTPGSFVVTEMQQTSRWIKPLPIINHAAGTAKFLRCHSLGDLGEYRGGVVRLKKISIYSILALTTEASCIMSMV
jgi:hypothetical protein